MPSCNGSRQHAHSQSLSTWTVPAGCRAVLELHKLSGPNKHHHNLAAMLGSHYATTTWHSAALSMSAALEQLSELLRRIEQAEGVCAHAMGVRLPEAPLKRPEEKSPPPPAQPQQPSSPAHPQLTQLPDAAAGDASAEGGQQHADQSSPQPVAGAWERFVACLRAGCIIMCC